MNVLVFNPTVQQLLPVPPPPDCWSRTCPAVGGGCVETGGVAAGSMVPGAGDRVPVAPADAGAAEVGAVEDGAGVAGCGAAVQAVATSKEHRSETSDKRGAVTGVPNAANLRSPRAVMPGDSE